MAWQELKDLCRWVGGWVDTEGRSVLASPANCALSYAVLLNPCCRPAGAVVHADIVNNPDGTSKGWGVVAFATPSDADAAIQVALVLGDGGIGGCIISRVD